MHRCFSNCAGVCLQKPQSQMQGTSAALVGLRTPQIVIDGCGIRGKGSARTNRLGAALRDPRKLDFTFDIGLLQKDLAQLLAS